MEIDYMNKKRGIQLEHSEDEVLLYSYSRDVTMKQLVAMCEKYAPAASVPEGEDYDINDLKMTGMYKS